jgi:hypothetical protein
MAKKKTSRTAPEVPDDLLAKVNTKTKPVKAQPPPAKPPEPTQPEAAEEVADQPEDRTTQLDDQATNQAVDDIAAKEANTMLELQDAIGRKATRLADDLAQQDRRRARRRRWAWFSLFILVAALLLLATPYTPYTCRWSVAARLRLTTDILPSVCK